jgi:hypothetical protein
MKEACPSDVSDGRSDLLASVNYIYAKCIDSIASDVIAIDSRDQDLTFMIVHEQAANHDSVQLFVLYSTMCYWINLSEKKYKFCSQNCW